MEWLFPQETKTLKGQEVSVSPDNLSSDWISLIIKYWRLWYAEKVIWLADYLVSKKILTKNYIMKRALIFSYEDGWQDMIKMVSQACDDYDKTSMQWKKNEKWEREKSYTWVWDNNIYRRCLFRCAVMPKRRQTTSFSFNIQTEWVNWLEALNNGIEYQKELEKTWVKIPSYALDNHSKTGKEYKKQWYTLDKRYSWDWYWNKYMELEHWKNGKLDPNKIDEDLEKLAESQKYKNF